MAFDKIVDSAELDADLGSIADEVRPLIGTEEKMSIDEMVTNLVSANEEVSTQAQLIEQLKEALSGKAIAGKEEQEKEIVISENGDYEVFPDDKKVLKRVSVKANVVDNAINELEDLIDNSGVLDNTEGTATEKVEQLIDKASWENRIQESLYNLPSNEAHTVFKRTSVKDVSMFDFSKVGTFNYMFLLCNDLEHIELDMPSVINALAVFQNCSNLKTVKLHNTATNRSLASAFAGCENLISVETLDCSSITAYANPFLKCGKLVTLKFAPETIKASIPIPSPVLSAESIQSIIDGLATVSTAQTLTLHKDITLTDEQKATIYNKGWTLAQ